MIPIIFSAILFPSVDYYQIENHFNQQLQPAVVQPETQPETQPTTSPVSSELTLPVEAVNLVKHFEGLKLTRYYCPSGKLTIGYGHTGKGTRKQKITIPEAEKLLEQDLSVFQKVVTNNVKVPLTNSQFGALVSFSFNVGEGAFKKSTVLKKLNSGNYKLASQEMLRWTRDSRKRILPGLVRRRQAEVKLFLVETT
jgi:lysozyme